ncbi:hypothetical protein HPB50_015640 [Hyalomma asiaticum]|uniref:Uncharacterized protein n=1 Tax=Hyalomma asiaticum TaxID=266040 RepID=A0ACB7TL75_HYAAI|nr:hypothetical protein HPB50_015640 [Hyalomma asiaticum]
MVTVNVPEELVQHLLRQMSRSTTEREQIVAAVRQKLMAAEAVPISSTVAAVHPASDCAPRSTGGQPGQPPRFKRFNDPQSPEEYLDRLKTFCLVSGVAANKAYTHCTRGAGR